MELLKAVESCCGLSKTVESYKVICACDAVLFIELLPNENQISNGMTHF